jgi:hypothetical protein
MPCKFDCYANKKSVLFANEFFVSIFFYKILINLFDPNIHPSCKTWIFLRGVIVRAILPGQKKRHNYFISTYQVYFIFLW